MLRCCAQASRSARSSVCPRTPSRDTSSRPRSSPSTSCARCPTSFWHKRYTFLNTGMNNTSRDSEIPLFCHLPPGWFVLRARGKTWNVVCSSHLSLSSFSPLYFLSHSSLTHLASLSSPSLLPLSLLSCLSFTARQHLLRTHANRKERETERKVDVGWIYCERTHGRISHISQAQMTMAGGGGAAIWWILGDAGLTRADDAGTALAARPPPSSSPWASAPSDSCACDGEECIDADLDGFEKDSALSLS